MLSTFDPGSLAETRQIRAHTRTGGLVKDVPLWGEAILNKSGQSAWAYFDGDLMLYLCACTWG